ncbi:MAG TPA: hypothetical protein VIK52_10045 [Opitutaceae bacterium]
MTDFLRFWWSLLRWNTSKTLFLLRGRKGRAPCQHPSDSGRAGVTGCEACNNWRRPSRFRLVCPLLVRNEAGWRCSVDAARVRPFWGRAIVFGALGAGGVYLAAALAALLTFRAVGYSTLEYRDFFSTAFRTRFREAQAGYYANRADEYFKAGDYRGGLLALSVAYNKNPRDWATGLTLARLLQRSNQPRIGDDVFEKLLGDFPDRAEEVSAVWSEALLFRADWLRLGRLAAVRVAAGGPSRGAWMRTLVFALRMLPDAQANVGFAECRPLLGGAYPGVLEAEIALREKDMARARSIVAGLPAMSDPYLAQYAVEFAIDTGDLAAASIAAAALEQTLGTFFHNLYSARIAADLGQPSVAALSFGNLLGPPVTLEKLDFACAEILRRPASDRLQVALDAFASSPEARARPEYVMALVAAAAATGDKDGLERLYEASVALDGTTIARLRLLADAIAGKTSEISPTGILTGYPFPRETMLALIDWFEKQRQTPVP